MKENVILSDQDFLSAGGRRECYIHPNNANQCIKIPKNKAGIKDCLREVTYFSQVKKRLNQTPLIYSKFHYSVNTNKGLGYVYDLIKDRSTGEVSRPLEEIYLCALFQKDKNLKKRLDIAIQGLLNTLRDNKLLATDLNAKNILVQYTNDSGLAFNLVIIDGLGRSNRIPAIDRLGLTSMRKVEKYHQRKLGLIIKTYNEVYQQLKNSKGFALD